MQECRRHGGVIAESILTEKIVLPTTGAGVRASGATKKDRS